MPYKPPASWSSGWSMHLSYVQLTSPHKFQQHLAHGAQQLADVPFQCRAYDTDVRTHLRGASWWLWLLRPSLDRHIPAPTLVALCMHNMWLNLWVTTCAIATHLVSRKHGARHFIALESCSAGRGHKRVLEPGRVQSWSCQARHICLRSE